MDNVNINSIRHVAAVNIVAYFFPWLDLGVLIIMATCTKFSLMPALLSFVRLAPRVLPCAKWRAGLVFPIMRPTVISGIKTN